MSVHIAYLAPEVPALSATFVYEELLALERAGYVVHPYSVHRPGHAVAGHEALAARTGVLYDRPAWRTAWSGVRALLRCGRRAWSGVRWCVADIRRVGGLNVNGAKLAFQFLAAARLARDLQRSNCRHLHVHFAHVPAQIGMYASALSGVPFSITGHANDLFERSLLLEEKASRATRLVTISQFNVDHLAGKGIPRERLAVVRCGVSFPMRRPLPPFVGKSTYRVGTLARFVEKKGLDDLLRAMALLKPTPRVELSIAGGGPLEAELRSLCEVLHLSDRVRFEGPLDHAVVIDWMRGLDAFVLPCKPDRRGDMDGIPVVLMEAMSQGVPVISTRVSGIPELVIDSRTGLLADPGDPASLADAITALLGNLALCERLAAQAQVHVQTEFAQGTNLARLVSAIGLPHLEG